MKPQLDWLAPETAVTLPHQRHSDTSRAAAKSAQGMATKLRGKVLDAIRSARGGLTDEEISSVTGINPNTVRPRRVELERLALIFRGGTRKTRSGRQAVVWEAAR